MYCLQWLLPVLLIPKPLNPALWFNHSMFMGFYLETYCLSDVSSSSEESHRDM
eukprot:gi/632940011/ref/XP_007883933.1/ PREDICTED: LOW QUALITY PROTEIN: bladder cancer-associated protein [Callorhinchus milii]